MRTTLSTVIALASSASLVSATGWTDALSFACPSNTNNVCNTAQTSGFDWTGLGTGSFSTFGGFNFNGWTCANSFDGSKKRDAITGRTIQDKCITGVATTEKTSCPSFGCGTSVNDFSVTEFYVSVEFDCTLEFHYGMPDGSTCKHKSSCSKGGSSIKNTQCGGAKNVTVVYPTQPKNPGKSSCSIGVHSVGFDCSTASSTVPPKTYSQTTTTHSTSVATTPSSSEVITTSSVVSTSAIVVTSSTPVETTTSSLAASSTSIPPVVVSTSTPPFGNTTSTLGVASTSTTLSIPPSTTAFTTSTVFTTFISTIISCAATVTDCPAHSTALTTVTVALSTTICPVTATEVGSTAVASSSVVVPPSSTTVEETTTTSSPAESVPAATSTTAVGETTTTSVSVPAESAPGSTTTSAIGTETSVAATTFVPAPSDVVTTVIIDTTTTLCPVTLTHTIAGVTSLETSISTSTIIVTATSTICTKCEAASSSAALASSSVATFPLITSTTALSVASTTSETAAAVTTAACPDLLPSCLNTWLFSSGCSSNTDSSCYCPSSTFVSNIYACLSAHGATDAEIATAQSFFQGICAAHVSTNPAIITAASTITVSETISAGASSTGSTLGVVTTQAPGPVTTVQILTTLTVPCTETAGPSQGSVIPNSSTVTVISTQLTVPQVVFQTITGSSTSSAALVQGTAPATVAAGTTTGIVAQTTLATSSVSGAIAGTTTPAQFTGAADRNGVAGGVIGAAVLFAVMVL